MYQIPLGIHSFSWITLNRYLVAWNRILMLTYWPLLIICITKSGDRAKTNATRFLHRMTELTQRSDTADSALYLAERTGHFKGCWWQLMILVTPVKTTRSWMHFSATPTWILCQNMTDPVMIFRYLVQMNKVFNISCTATKRIKLTIMLELTLRIIR